LTNILYRAILIWGVLATRSSYLFVCCCGFCQRITYITLH